MSDTKMSGERAREILCKFVVRATDPTDYVEVDLDHETCDAIELGAAAIAERDEARNKALEEAAKVCEAGATECNYQHGLSLAEVGWRARAKECEFLASKIRALALSPSPEGASGGA